MDETSSFFGMKDGIKHILIEPKVAFISNGDFIHYFKDYHCKVCMYYHLYCTVWTVNDVLVDPHPFYCIKMVWIDQNKKGCGSTKTSLTVHPVSKVE